MLDNDKTRLISNLDILHTTDLGAQRIRKNLSLDSPDAVEWCKKMIKEPDCNIIRQGKNWYAIIYGNEITINAYSYTIITAHKKKAVKV